MEVRESFLEGETESGPGSNQGLLAPSLCNVISRSGPLSSPATWGCCDNETCIARAIPALSFKSQQEVLLLALYTLLIARIAS